MQAGLRDQELSHSSPEPTYSLEDLVNDIKEHLGTSSGIGSEDVDEDYLMSLVKRYATNPNDWARYYYNCPGKNYTRNAIENINHKANIVSLKQLGKFQCLFLLNLAAPVGLESSQGFSNSRPCQRPLHHEGPSRGTD